MTDAPLTRWELTVVLRSPFLIPGPSVHATAVDVRPAVNGDGRPIIPGSLIRGLFRDAVKTVGFDDVLALFGRASGGTDGQGAGAAQRIVDNEPRRRLLDFSDLTATEKPSPDMLVRVALDEQTGAGKEGHLQFMELVAPLGREVTFKGDITCRTADPDGLKAQLERAARLIRAVGSNKSSGFGEVAALSVQVLSSGDVGSDRPLPRWGDIVLELDRPFLVNAEPTTSNLFKGDECIPGAVLKGALAPRFAAAGIAADAISTLHIGHAVPIKVPEDGATEEIFCVTPVLPLSLALCKKSGCDTLTDLLLIEDVTTLLEKDVGPPVLAVDWKPGQRDQVLKALKITPPDLSRDLRTRTALDPETGTTRYDDATETGALFSCSAVVPRGHRWVSRWFIPDNIDDQTVQRLRTVLMAGIPGIGKTGATATVQDVRGVASVPASPLSGEETQWAVTLQTDAAMGDGREQDYRAYWRDNGFRLIRHFARQRLVGGYQALRYPACETGYMPYVLTCAGSVFLLDGPRERLEELLRCGLPPVAPYNERDWKTFPFGRENGFGAIAVNVVDHAGLKEGLDV